MPHTRLPVVVPDPGETIRSVLDARADAHPEKTYIQFPDADGFVMTYADAARGADLVAAAMVARGLTGGSRVALYLGNTPEYVAAWLGCLSAGVVDVSASRDLHGEALAYTLEKARVDAVLTDLAGAQSLAELRELTVSPAVVVFGTDLPDRAAWSTVAIDQIPPDPADPVKLASIRFTSGSTGLPKGVMMSQAHMLASARMFCHLTDFGPDDILYSCFPVHHVFSSVTGILATLCAGGTMALGIRFSARNFWPRVRRYEATIIHLLDAPATILMALPESDLDRVHQCRVAFTAANQPPGFADRFGVPIVPLFDMSELTVVACYPEGTPRRASSCGVSSGLFDIAILDEHDTLLKAGEEGELAVRPRVPHVMALGYFDDAELTVERTSNLWFHTGDLAVLDADGYLYFRGRAGDRIRRRGTNISASQIEEIAASHPVVGEAAAIGVPSDLGEDDIKLAVTLLPGSELAPADLQDWLRRELPKVLVPQYVEIRADFPRTQTQKIRKNVLREEGKRGLTPTTWVDATGTFVGEFG